MWYLSSSGLLMAGDFRVGKTRSLLGARGGGGSGFPVEDRGQRRGKFCDRESGTGRVIPGPAPLPFLELSI
ncbi:unnamed protein product [Camellia sinensis]